MLLPSTSGYLSREGSHTTPTEAREQEKQDNFLKLSASALCRAAASPLGWVRVEPRVGPSFSLRSLNRAVAGLELHTAWEKGHDGSVLCFHKLLLFESIRVPHVRILYLKQGK